MYRRAKIVATLGPASQDVKIIRELIQAGTNVFRINFSHGTQADHATTIRHVRQVAKELGQPITILQDLQGPKIRTGEIENGQTLIKSGQKLTLTTKPMLGNQECVSVDYPKLPNSVQVGNRILLDEIGRAHV